MLSETLIYSRKKQLVLSTFVTVCSGQLLLKMGMDVCLGPRWLAVAGDGFSSRRCSMKGSDHSVTCPAKSDHLQASDGQPTQWGRSGVTGGPEQSQSHSAARGRKAFPLHPDIYSPVCQLTL